ncbi:S8 family serine peptidase [uncultured Adlercreutzia sp.]|uniref:S8 family serine peptidase n=1 Tax=uncultured Adlercreutzia sp. TaxID=875803 RepID=UPI002676E915|nr:S8 family serine peptidase [uncultured Adlercreutzia sp.]
MERAWMRGALPQGARRGLSCLLALTLAVGGVAIGPRTAVADEPEGAPAEQPAEAGEETGIFDDAASPAAEPAATEGDAAGGSAAAEPLAAEEPAAVSEDEEAEVPAAEEDTIAVPETVAPAAVDGDEPGEIVVVFEKGTTTAQQNGVVRLLGAPGGETVAFDLGDVTLVEVADGMTAEAAAEVAEESDGVKYAVPNYSAELFDKAMAESAANAESLAATVKDPYAADQWYLDAVGAAGAWSAIPNRGSAAPVKVAVLDTGASVSHPDLSGTLNRTQSKEVVWTSRYSRFALQPLRGDGYTNGSSSIQVASTHGTHVAGIIGAQANSIGVLGVASGGATANANKLVDVVAVDIFSENVMTDEGLQPNATLYDVVVGLDHARDTGCSVVNMSLGFIESNRSLVDFMNEVCTELADGSDMVIVCAAGNESTSAATYPAACDDAIGVISVNESLTRSSFSNYGAWCDISAPGSNILSTIVEADKVTNGYGYLSGTSMASPVVAATAAMVRAARPELTAAEVRSVLCSTAQDVGAKGKDAQTGYGVVNAAKAVAAARDMKLSGWRTVRGSTYYYGTNGQAVKGSQKIGGSWYYFDSTGAMQTGWLTWSDGTKSYFDWDGKALLGWRSFSGVKYYFDPSTGKSLRWSQKIGGSWYYFDGKSVMQKGWVTWKDGTKSYFHPDSSGHAAALLGWRSFSGVKYYFDPATGISKRWSQKIGGQWYYFDSSSRMKTGWITWSNGSKSYFDWDGHALTGWRSFSGVKYYFDPATAMSLRWSQKINGKWYYFDSSSRMQKGWITWKDGTKSYFHPDSSGHAAALTGWRSFSGVKYYFDTSTGISKRWSQTIGGYWYYFDSASRMKKGWVTWNDGKKSYFDANGRAVTGWQTIGGKRYYFDPATYKTSGPVSQQTPSVARTVYWVASGEVYHTTKDCVSLKRSKNILSGTIAQSGKKRVCSNCG